ncbi:MAG TPA: glutathione peroxidase [Myxococcota bacterium]|nr:glutathione peroxidase [Myxococcota bacterium]
MPRLQDFRARTIDGQERSLADFDGKVALVVNVASKCGLTPHYAGLQKLYEAQSARGLEVLGFPCNQFGSQEPGSEAEVKEFCSLRYGVTFPMFSKIEVNGAARHPLYAWLAAEPTAPEGSGDIKWNFTKFLIGRDGRVLARFDPRTEPTAPELVAAVEKALG